MTKPARNAPLPIEIPHLAGYDIDAQYGTARIGGDFFDTAANSSSVALLLTDIAGERHDALELAVEVQEAFRQCAPRLLSKDPAENDDAVVFALRSINLALMSAARGVRCASTFLARLDLATGGLQYVNAGAAPALLTNRGVTVPLESHGLPLGLFNELAHQVQTAQLEPDGSLVLVSKGVVEARRKGEEFGLDGVQRIVAQRHGSARETNRKILRSAIEYAHGGVHAGFFGPALSIPGFRKPELEQDMTTFTMIRNDA